MTTQHKRINIEIEFESRLYGSSSWISANHKLSESIYTEYNSLLDKESILSDVKLVLKTAKKWQMITVNVTIANDGDYSGHRYTKPLLSRRYLNETGVIKTAPLEGNSYTDWQITDIKSLYAVVADSVAIANNKYIQEIKAIAAATSAS